MTHFRNSKCLLALLLFAGIWRGGAVQARAPDSLSSRGGLLVGYGNFNGGGIVDPIRHLSIGNWAITAWQNFRIHDWTLKAELQRSVSLSRLEVVDHNLDARVDPEPAITSLQFTISPPARRIALTLGVHLADKGTDRAGYTARLWIQPIRSFGMGVEATAPRWSRPLSAMYDGEGGALSWNATIARTRWSTSFSPMSRWRLSGTIIQDRINPRPVEIARTSDYALRPSGLLLRRSFECKRISDGGVGIAFVIANGDLTGQADAYTEGTRFVRVGVIESAWQHWDFRLARRSPRGGWSTLLSYGSAELASLGVLKLWPFTEGLQALLGPRRNVDFAGSVNWWKLGLGFDRYLTRHVKVGMGVDTYRIWPNVRLFSWQPLLFGMGISDPRTSTLNIQRADLAHVRLSTAAHLTHRIQLHGSLGQWIPLSIEKESKAETGGATASDVTQAEGRKLSFGDGLVVSLSLEVGW